MYQLLAKCEFFSAFHGLHKFYFEFRICHFILIKIKNFKTFLKNLHRNMFEILSFIMYMVLILLL